MYIVEFLQKEQSKSFKRFLKKNKAWNRKQLGLKAAESLIQKYIAENQQNDQVLLLLQDIENEKAYEFTLPVGVGENFSLLTSISKDLEDGTDFNLAMEIKQGIYVSYKNEEEQGNVETEEETPKKKKGGFFSKLFGKKGEEAPHAAKVDTREHNDNLQKEFAEEENLFEEMSTEEMQHRGTNIFEESDLASLEMEVNDSSTEEKKDIFAIEETDNYQDLSVDLEKDHEELPFDTHVSDSIKSIEEELYSEPEKEEIQEQVIVMPTKDVSFPEYDKYLDLREVEAKQNRYDSRFTVNHLLGLLGMSEETAQTALEKKKLQFVKNVLSGKEFLLIQDKYYQDVKNVVDDIRLILERAYEETVMRDYQKEAEDRLRETFEANLQEKLQELNAFENKENQEMQQKLNAFSEKQQLELQSFKLKQEAEFKAYESDLEERKLTLVSAREEELMKDNNIEQEKRLHEKVYELKVEANKSLIDKKNELLADFSGSLEDIMNAAFEMQESELKNLQDYMERLIPGWKEEIQAEHEKEIKERQLEVEEEKNRIEKEALNLEQRKQEALEMKTSGRERELLNIIEDLNNKLIKAYAGTGQMPSQQPIYMYAQPVQQPVYMYQQPVQQPFCQQPAQQPVMQQQSVAQPQAENNSKKRGKLFEKLMGSN
ncbi:hypothetical protein R6231_14640 [Bacillus cytotoxicus]|uniref:hypothetical protein n=1 Tax=Bacillus cereus group TaxID=86661 RepID=UPI000B96DF24|nr:MULTISPECIES: hypothetical protein [Bacillus cereus group]AWC30983.1 hypothetical protein CG483_022455 [Bacillus cytotoxicus]AWC43075.1 hypothetical protein CG480_022290 [Bacillus cytotoxicus]AWC47012.1 hypothetical protein CG479_021660 [Bacillus cytotoxicus]AWC51006.1 hypothetical protein CG478_022290 [Bacillus cytotoxicus]AWC55122.1 hypothetical protein CG477_022695 [Bacillus cytotoxicus]